MRNFHLLQLSESSVKAHSWFRWCSEPKRPQSHLRRGTSRTHSRNCGRWYSSEEDKHRTGYDCPSYSQSCMILSLTRQTLYSQVFWWWTSALQVVRTGRWSFFGNRRQVRLQKLPVAVCTTFQIISARWRWTQCRSRLSWGSSRTLLPTKLWSSLFDPR